MMVGLPCKTVHDISDTDIVTDDEYYNLQITLRLIQMQSAFLQAIDYRKARQFSTPLEQIHEYRRLWYQLHVFQTILLQP